MSSDDPKEMATETEVYHSLESIEESLAESLPDDPRLKSGISKDISGDDPRFIEMSGLATAGEPSSRARVTGDFVDEEQIESPEVSDAVLPEPFPTNEPEAVPSVPIEENASTEPPSMPWPDEQPPTNQTEALKPDTEQTPSDSPQKPADVDSHSSSSMETPAVVDLPASDSDENDIFEAESLLQELEQETESYQPEQRETRTPVEGEVVVGAESLSPGFIEDEDYVPSAKSPDVKEAQELVEALQAQITPAPSEPEEAPEPSVDNLPTQDTGEPSSFTGFPTPTHDEASNQSRGDQPENRAKKRSKRGHRKSRHIQRKIARLVLTVVVLILMTGAGFTLYQWYQRISATPEAIFSLAQRMTAKGDFARAITLYDDLLQRHPDHPLKGTAQFSRAFLTQAQAERQNTASESVYRKAITEFEQFLKENPGHPKAARAQTLLGILYFRVSDYPRAIELLGNPELRLSDPAASLSILRTLAQAYLQTGNIASAQQALLQAASLDVNPSPDRDYDELGNIYIKLSETAPSDDDRLRYQQMALLYWERAATFPGINPPTRNAIQNKIDLLKEKTKTPFSKTESEKNTSRLESTSPEAVDNANDSDEVTTNNDGSEYAGEAKHENSAGLPPENPAENTYREAP